jgi:membrane peptidoglycan carboxypeptidase
MFKKLVKRIFLIIISIVCLSILGGITSYYWLVVFSPGDEISEDNIERILAIESPVFYSDGSSKIGVFFQEAHRQYVPFSLVPKDFVNAIVAAEDSAFFDHYGVDFFGMARATLVNLQARRVVQGGSTITQQTAKNLFRRKGRSLRSKLKELLYALRLEYHYPKEKILEFYINQFYVSGNGHGLGVAARYYFDKSVDELDILECAFIAGSVKRPNYYNPFIKKNEELSEEAGNRARMRTKYVLTHMYNLGMIDTARYQTNLDRDVPFSQGRTYYSFNTAMDLVKEALAEPEVEEALADRGIDNVATSGIRIVTTLDRDLQESSLYSLRKELSRLDIRLKGYDAGSIQDTYESIRKNNREKEGVKSFLFGSVVEIEKSPSHSILVRFSESDVKEETKGRVDKAGLMNLISPLAKYKGQRWTKPGKNDLDKVVDQFKVGDPVYVSIREVDEITDEYILDLEKYPEMQGGALVMEHGFIRAMVGGMDNRFYNRAITARRELGSVLKPLVYCAALQLCWNSVDILHNLRNVFIYQKQAYFPRPDHESPHEWVSMNWAGTKSENVATVWLLYHLCDRLSPGRFKEVIAHLGLSRGRDESYEHYRQRVRDEFGIIVNRDALYDAAFTTAVERMEPDLMFSGRHKEFENLRMFLFDAMTEMYPLKRRSGREEEIRRSLLDKNFIRYIELNKDLSELKQDVLRFSGDFFDTGLYWETGVLSLDDKYGGQAPGSFIYSRKSPGTGWTKMSRDDLMTTLLPMNENEQEVFWNSILIDGMLTPATIEQLQEYMENEYDRLNGLPPYSAEVLHRIRDFRVLAGLRYMVAFGRACNIKSRLDPVLSFPLGSNVISLLEAANVYEVLATGETSIIGTKGSGNGLRIIDRIEDRDGEVIYKPKRTARRITDFKSSLVVTDILRNVVKYGTGRYADKRVKLRSSDPEKEERLSELDISMPVMGKTGTANRFRNAAFVGIVPGLDKEGNRAVLEDCYVVAVYVGFDDNRSMVRTSTHITGSSGALPLWTRLANAVILDRKYAKEVDVVDMSFAGFSEMPFHYPDLGQVKAPVDPGRGGTVIGATDPLLEIVLKNRLAGEDDSGEDSATTIVTFGKESAEGEMKPARYFLPFWRMRGN